MMYNIEPCRYGQLPNTFFENVTFGISASEGGGYPTNSWDLTGSSSKYSTNVGMRRAALGIFCLFCCKFGVNSYSTWWSQFLFCFPSAQKRDVFHGPNDFYRFFPEVTNQPRIAAQWRTRRPAIFFCCETNIIYPLVFNVAIGNGHRNSWFTQL